MKIYSFKQRASEELSIENEKLDKPIYIRVAWIMRFISITFFALFFLAVAFYPIKYDLFKHYISDVGRFSVDGLDNSISLIIFSILCYIQLILFIFLAYYFLKANDYLYLITMLCGLFFLFVAYPTSYPADPFTSAHDIGSSGIYISISLFISLVAFRYKKSMGHIVLVSLLSLAMILLLKFVLLPQTYGIFPLLQKFYFFYIYGLIFFFSFSIAKAKRM